MFFGEDRKVVGIVGVNSADYVRRAFQSIEAGSVTVTLRSEDDFERKVAVGVEETVVPDRNTGWVRDLSYPQSDLNDIDIAQVLFSSGTEGVPKAILLSHGALANTTDRLISVMQINADIREYVGVPVYYSFGFGRCRAVSKAGGAFYIPPKGFDPLEIATLLERGEINALSAVPSLWRMLLQSPELFEQSGRNMRWIEIGSQYMSCREKEQLRAIFPAANIVQHYGLTEASRTTFLCVHESEGEELESVGTAMQDVEVSIGREGEIKVRGPHLASGVVDGGVIKSLTDQDGWFVTSDKGYFEGEHLFYSGRSDDIINCGGVKLSPDLVEQDLYRELGIGSGISVSKVSDDVRGEIPLVCYLKELNLDQDKLKNVIGSMVSSGGLPLDKLCRFFETDSFPKTETGKIQRKKLAETYSSAPETELKRPRESELRTNQSDDLTRKLVDIWEDVLNIRPISVDDSFFDLGGDSLSVIRVSVGMEKAGIDKEICRKIFEGHSISQIVSASRDRAYAKSASEVDYPALEDSIKQPLGGTKTPVAAASQSINIVRGLLVLANIAAHWGEALVLRLPAVFIEINMYFSVFYSSGTPGFAIVFGVGIGFFFLPRFLKDPSSVAGVLRRNATLLGAGILCLALLKVAAGWVNGVSVTGMSISNAFWSVLTFYFYALVTLFFWLKIVAHRKDFSISCLAIALGCYGIHMLVDAADIRPSNNPVLQHFVLLLTAKYNYFEMSSGVFLGAAVGNWFREAVSAQSGLRGFAVFGVLLIFLSVAISLEMGESDLWLTWPKPISIWSWPLYLGCVLLVLVLTHHFFTTRKVSLPLNLAVNVLSIIGILAFPLFVGHEMVSPLRDLLGALGVSWSLPIAVGIFFVAAGYLVLKLYRLYFGAQAA